MNIQDIKNEIGLLNKEIKYKKFNDLMNNYFNLFGIINLDQIQKLNLIFSNLNSKKICFSLRNNGINQKESIVLLDTRRKPTINDIVPILRKKIAKLKVNNEEEIAFVDSAKQLNESFYFLDDSDIETLNELFDYIYNNIIILNDYTKYGINGNSIEIDIENKAKFK